MFDNFRRSQSQSLLCMDVIWLSLDLDSGPVLVLQIYYYLLAVPSFYFLYKISGCICHLQSGN